MKSGSAVAVLARPQSVVVTDFAAVAKLRRYATSSTYGSILKEFRVTDRIALEIGTLIHEIEINKWARKSTAESIEVEKRVRRIVAATKCNGPQKLDTKQPFLRWWAALKMKESQCPEHVRVTRPL